MNAPLQPEMAARSPGSARGHRKRAGLTLVELLVALVIFSILALGLQQIAGVAGSAVLASRGRQDLLANGRFAMDQIVAFVQESDAIDVPASNRLVVSERRLDTYHNLTRVFAPEGDGRLDADSDSNGLVNDNVNDGQEQVVFTHDEGAHTLLQALPDYGAASPWLATTPGEVICEQVKSFGCTLLATNLVQIELSLDDGINAINLQTRARARRFKGCQ